MPIPRFDESWLAELLCMLTMMTAGFRLQVPRDSRGVDLALGIAFRVPREGLSQLHNVLMTLSQRRYLLNASSVQGTAYLNIMLSEEEWPEVVKMNGEGCHWGKPAFVRDAAGELPAGVAEDQEFKPAHDKSPLWSVIVDGLKLYGIPPASILNVARFTLNVGCYTQGSRLVKMGDHRCLALLVGDALMQTHFWPGRGLNSGIKSAAEAARAIARSWRKAGRIREGTAMEDPILDFEGFIQRLRTRELDRSGRFLCQKSMKVKLRAADAYTRGRGEVTNELVKGALGWLKTLSSGERANQWPHGSVDPAALEARVR